MALGAREWYHLFNPDDHVLTYPISLSASNFEQVTTEFDIPNDILNHDATYYLDHPNAVATVWKDLVGGPQPKSFTSIARGVKRVVATPTRRALMIGINDYPDPRNKLEGCVNDAFLMSSVLQECGFEAGEIRLVLNERATTDAIMDRLHWLLDDVHDGDERMLFYSGHGAQIPEYGAQGEPDHVDECLVPYDFDWSPAHAITDKQFCELYSQLPYGSHFVAVFDCCHAGGMTRDGGPRIRGLTPPDDIRHRALQWSVTERMWIPRKFPSVNESLADSREGRAYLGQGGWVHRLGRGATLRTLPQAKYNSTRAAFGHFGPYLPILMEACQEEGFSYEYRHGATSYGAYTFSLALVLHENREANRNLSYSELSQLTTEKLHRLDYQQTPSLVGAKKLLTEDLPWSRPPKAPDAARAQRRRRARRRNAADSGFGSISADHRRGADMAHAKSRSSGASRARPRKQADWTIMVYLAGDNNLDGAAGGGPARDEKSWLECIGQRDRPVRSRRQRGTTKFLYLRKGTDLAKDALHDLGERTRRSEVSPVLRPGA